MKRFFYKAFKFMGSILLVFIGFIILYLLVGITLSAIPCNRNFKAETSGVEIYILSNGVHTDLVLPAKNTYKDWTREIKADNTLLKDTAMNFIAFGWGDKGFYLETPSWADLKFSTAFKAAFAMGGSAMHVTNYKTMQENKACKKIILSKEAYAKMVVFIEKSFSRGNTGDLLFIKNHAYGDHDAFYEANGNYSLFYTCNTWANEGLKHAGIKTCIWTPFDKGIFFHF